MASTTIITVIFFLEPTREDVQDLAEFVQQLMAARLLRRSSVVLRMLHRAAFESRFLAWQVAAIAIADAVERQCFQRHGFVMPNSVLYRGVADESRDEDPDADYRSR